MDYSTTVKGNRIQVLMDAIDSKTYASALGAGALGSLVIGTSLLSGATGVLATFTLQNPSFTRSGFVATLAGLPLETTGSADGTAAKAEIRNNAGTVIVSGLTVGEAGSGANIIIDDDVIATSELVRVTAGTITHG